MSKLGRVTLVTKKIEELTPAEYNPRTMSDKARQGLSNSIDTFGLVQPIIYNKRTGNVIGGHQRLTDLIIKGVKETDVVEVDFDLAREKALNVALNHSGISGDYEAQKLKEILDGLDEELITSLNFGELILEEFKEEHEQEDFASKDENDIHTSNECPMCKYKW